MSYGEHVLEYQGSLLREDLPEGVHVLEPKELDVVARYVFLIEELVARHFDTRTEEDVPREEWIRLQRSRIDTRLELLDSITNMVIMGRRDT